MVKTLPDGSFVSAVTTGAEQMEYSIDQITTDDYGIGVFTFETRKQAREFVSTMGRIHLKILKVETFNHKGIRFSPWGQSDLFKSVKPIAIAR